MLNILYGSSGPPRENLNTRGMSPGELRVMADAGQMAAAQCRWLMDLGEVDPDSGECKAFYSKAAWLTWRCSMHMRTASEYVAVADKLKTLGRINYEFFHGRLSYSQVRMLTRVATPEIEQLLIDVAQASTVGQLSRVVGSYRKVLEAEADAEATRQNRSLATWFDEQGFFIIRGRLCPEDGAVVDRALRRVLESMPAPPPARSSREETPGDAWDHYGARQADALAQMAREHLAAEAADRRAANLPEVIVHYDFDALSGKPEGDCHLEEGIAIARSTAERIACDCAVVPLIEDATGNPLWIGRRSRVISRGMRRALMARDKGCRFPGCPGTRWLEGHHAEHWARGGKTDLENLVFLCQFHHRLIHSCGYSVKPVNSGFEFYRPDGSLIPATHSPPTRTGNIRARNIKRGAVIAADAIKSGWDGERMNLGYVIDIICLTQEGRTSPSPPPVPELPRPPDHD